MSTTIVVKRGRVGKHVAYRNARASHARYNAQIAATRGASQTQAGGGGVLGAGWVCLVLSALVALPLPGAGIAFGLATFILAIIAIAKGSSVGGVVLMVVLLLGGPLAVVLLIAACC